MANRGKYEPKTDERLELLFKTAGLAEKQAKLYRLLLIAGEDRPSTLSRKSGIKRANTYALLEDLARRGLITKFEKEKVIYFRPEPPQRIADLIENRQRETDIARELADDLVPNLSVQWKQSVNRPTVTYLEGEEGVKNIFEDIYAAGKSEIIGCVDLANPHEEMYAHIINHLMPLRIKRKIFTRALNADSARARELRREDKKRLSESFLSDPLRYPIPAEIDIYEDKVAMLSFTKNDFVGIRIQNDVFATTLRSVFRLLFDLLREKQNHLGEAAASQTDPTVSG